MNSVQLQAEAIKLFNDAQYWEVHEFLEPPWLEAQGIERAQLAGFILLAAALFQARVRRNEGAARRLYARSQRHWRPLPDRWGAMGLRRVERDVWRAIEDEAFMPHINSASSPL